MTSEKHFVTFPAAEFPYHAAYVESGEGIPLLFLHGFMGEGASWRSLFPHLPSGYRGIGLDLMGFGDSSKPMIRYDIAKQVTFVHHFKTALDLPACILVGHSLGGWVASAYALAYPEAVQGLALIAPAGIRDDSFCGRYDHLRPLLWQTPFVDVGLWLARPIAKRLNQQDALARLQWFRRELNAQPAARSFLLDRMRPQDAIDTVEKDIHRLRVPTLVITGDRDETIPLWHSQTYATQIPLARLEVIPNADHALLQDHGEAIANLLRAFLTDG